jgi:hypothetical protein
MIWDYGSSASGRDGLREIGNGWQRPREEGTRSWRGASARISYFSEVLAVSDMCRIREIEGTGRGSLHQAGEARSVAGRGLKRREAPSVLNNPPGRAGSYRPFCLSGSSLAMSMHSPISQFRRGVPATAENTYFIVCQGRVMPIDRTPRDRLRPSRDPALCKETRPGIPIPPWI